MRAPLLAAVLLAACTPTPEPTFPVTSEAAAQSFDALLLYLAQPGADPAVCDATRNGPHVGGLAPASQDAYVAAFTGGKIDPRTFRKCTRTMLPDLPAEDRAALFDRLLGAYGKLLGEPLETNPAAVERATVLQRLFLDRAPDTGPHPQVLADTLAKLKKAKHGPIATRLAQELIDTSELEQGSWHGAPVTTATMDALAAAGNELTLRRFMQRLPTAELRDEARRRILRIHIALSPFPEVQHGGTELEARLLATGVNAVALADHPVVKAYVDESHLKRRTLVVRQDVWRQRATIVSAQDGGGLAMVPALPLHGALTVELQGISRPITVCAKAADLDPSPCIAPSDLSIDQPLAQLDAAGALHVGDERPIASLIPLATQTQFAVPIAIGGKPATALSWALRFAVSGDLVFRGGGNGGRGPDVAVRIADGGPQRFEVDANAEGRTLIAILEASDLHSFHVGSIGGAGADGNSGIDGSSGTNGSECEDGGNGGDGTAGGDGDPGGDGGNVAVHVVSIARSRDELQRLVAPIVVSLGGNGGNGGQGGRGGAGGNGGSSRSPTTHTDSDGNTVTDDPGCSSGMSGSSGSDGANGADGASGDPGRITFD